MRRPSRAQLAAYARHPAVRSPAEAKALVERRVARLPVDPMRRERAWSARLPVLAAALGKAEDTDRPTPRTAQQLRDRLAGLLDPTDAAHAWLALAVLAAQLPFEETVVAVARRAEFDAGLALAQAIARATTMATWAWPVEVSDEVLVDVDHTLHADFLTGIQRVVVETVPRWIRARGATPVGWTSGYGAMRLLDDVEAARFSGLASVDRVPTSLPRVVVPWGGTYLLAELALELPRVDRIRALARFSPVRTGVIGYDCVPMTSSETVALGVGHFARNLAAVKYMDRVAAISTSSATEYEGWRQSLGGLGMSGPRVAAVTLPAEVPSSAPAHGGALGEDTGADGGIPLVLVVGSHEPRKNHLAVLHAAELLWREGLGFRLTFAGGRGWGSEPFVAALDRLRSQGRPVSMATAFDDPMLFAAYRHARFTVFPSLNEGFGLPLAESLACGTPAVTSDFGSMREIAGDGGALLVDPRDDHSIADAMRRLLLDDGLLARLRDEAARRPVRTWDDYAQDAWTYLVGGD